MQRFAASIGRKPNLIGQYVAWNTPFPAQPVARAWSYGALSYLAWEPYSVSVQSIADGHSDGYVTQFAKAVRALNDPVALSFGHEMNGFWYPWGTTHTTPAEFVAAWRRIHNLFAQAGASNVIWVWNPNDIFPVPQIQLKPYYPGNAYVDWIGVTGYFSTTGPHTYAQLYAPTIAEVRSFTSKPFIIAETSIETGPSEVLCARQLILRTVMAHPRMLGLIWFDYDKTNVDWRVESRPIVESAVRTDLSLFAVPRQAAMSRRDASQASPGRPVRPARPTQTRRAYRPFSRPEADTVMLPPVTADPGGGGPGEPGQRPPGGGPPGGRPGGPSGRGPSGRGPAAADPIERTRVLVSPRRRRRKLERSPFPPPSPRRIWVSRAVLIAILAVQAALSLRMRNTAFEDEALYLTAGHYELAHLLYGVPLPQDYASFFSGSPVLYPILGALADTAAGLAGARLVSLAAMLTTTALLYSLTRRLFNERVGLCAAVVFSVTESAIFLGNFATYDAPALCLLAVAAWIVVRTATQRWPVYLAAAPVAALAVGTKYAALLFVPTIVALATLAAWPYQGKRALIRSAALGVAIAGLLAAALRLAGPAIWPRSPAPPPPGSTAARRSSCCSKTACCGARCRSRSR